MFKNVQNYKKQGDVGMGYAIAYYARKGYTVSIPLTDSQDYDLIIDDGVSLSKVQVKTTSNKQSNGNYQVGLRTCGGNRSGQKIKTFDYNSSNLLFVLTEGGDCYEIPTNIVECRNALTLCEKYQQYRINL